ncbi:MAG TPA: S53 family peptidase [Candidatus Saccharimonadales bacterium]|nr:S53 family peptidase [Candidatus Saccharimonadales bacterium]
MLYWRGIALGLMIGLVAWGSFSPAQAATSLITNQSSRPVCPIGSQAPGQARCHADIVTDAAGNPLFDANPNVTHPGYGPAQFRGGYGVSGVSANPVTIAVVDAYGDSSIKSNLNTYDTAYGLPSFPSCTATITTSCFKKVNQRGGSSYPANDGGWALETALDVETVHAMCQNCKLLLVEADTASLTNLMIAEDEARALGAKVISNSFGGSETSGETATDSHFNHPGVAFTVSSGDSGYGVEYPAASQFVTAVGGTSLHLNSNNTWQSETVWSGAGSGCSGFEVKPTFQHDSGCGRRSVADVSADADPATGAAVYDSIAYQGHSGWTVVGGTSLASPLVAGVYGLAGGVSSSTRANGVPYSKINYSSNLHDITVGSNGSCGSYLCQGHSGYDGPSGLGSPKGFGAF